MKALSLWQPWASLISLGVKTIETRSWSTKYRGPLAIHAAKTREHLRAHDGDPATCHGRALAAACHAAPRGHPPLGAIVATCELVDVVPIVGWDKRQDCPAGKLSPVVAIDPSRDDREDGRQIVRVWQHGHIQDGLGVWSSSEGRVEVEYGDYSPGRYAWLLANIVALPEPVPCRGRQGLFDVEVSS